MKTLFNTLKITAIFCFIFVFTLRSNSQEKTIPGGGQDEILISLPNLDVPNSDITDPVPVNPGTSISNVSENNFSNINCFLNNGNLELSFESKKNEPTDIFIFDISGNLILKDTSVNSVKVKKTYGVNYLPQGIYLVKLVQSNKIKTKKFFM